jgi:hypothetical protein
MERKVYFGGDMQAAHDRIAALEDTIATLTAERDEARKWGEDLWEKLTIDDSKWQQEAGAWRQRAEKAEAERELLKAPFRADLLAYKAHTARLEEALRGLVELKAMKGELLNLRSDPYYASQAAMLEVQYEQRKPLAWDKARAALAQETQG